MPFLNRGSPSTSSSPQLSRKPSVASAYQEGPQTDNGVRPDSPWFMAHDHPVIQDNLPHSPSLPNGLGFRFRSRSNTKDSISSMLPSQPVTAPSSSESDLVNHYASELDNRASRSRSMFPRNRKTRRHSSKLSFGSVFDGMGEFIQVRATSSKGASTRQSPVHDGKTSENTSPSESIRKEFISAPFNFQHLTHTRPQHLPSLDQASEQKLATEFRTVRASQAPRRELFGIKAEDIRSPLPSAPPAPLRFPSQVLDSPNTFNVPLLSAPLTSARAASALETRPPHEPRTVKKARSVESFSQPFVKPRSPKSATPHQSSYSPLNPPPRTSSRQAQTKPHESPRAVVESPTAPSFSPAKYNDVASTLRNATTTSRVVDDADENWPINSSAASTLEECSRHNSATATPGYNTDLEDVPEEVEGYFPHRASGRPRVGSRSSSLRRSRSFPTVSPFTRPSSRDSNKADPSPSNDASERDGTSASPSHSSRSSRSIPRARYIDPFAVVSESIEGSWEDVIDYCYEHAAEADCDFDWDRASTIEAAETEDGLWMPKRTVSIRRKSSYRKPVGVMMASSKTPPRPSTSQDRPQIVVPAVTMVPDLASKSATSIGTSSTVPTPSDNHVVSGSFQTISPYGQSHGFNDERLIPIATPLPPKPHLYEEGLIDDLHSDPDSGIYRPHASDILDNRYSGPESIRSHLSKCSSEESFARPVLANSTTTSLNKRISTSSVGSLPDLVYSRRSATRPSNGPIAEQVPATQNPEPPHLPTPPAQQQQTLTRGRSATSTTDSPRRLSQSVAPTARDSDAVTMRRRRRASSAARMGAMVPSVLDEKDKVQVQVQVQPMDEGTRDLLQIGRPRRAGSGTLSLFPTVRSRGANAAVF